MPWLPGSDLSDASGVGLLDAVAALLGEAGLDFSAIVSAVNSIKAILEGVFTGSNLQLLYEVRGLTSSAKVVLTADTLEGAKQLYAAGADYVLIPQALTAEHLFRILCESSPNALKKARELQTSELFRRS